MCKTNCQTVNASRRTSIISNRKSDTPFNMHKHCAIYRKCLLQKVFLESVAKTKTSETSENISVWTAFLSVTTCILTVLALLYSSLYRLLRFTIVIFTLHYITLRYKTKKLMTDKRRDAFMQMQRRVWRPSLMWIWRFYVIGNGHKYWGIPKLGRSGPARWDGGGPEPLQTSPSPTCFTVFDHC